MDICSPSKCIERIMKIKLLTLSALVLLLSGCFKSETWDPGEWEHHFNGPIAKTKIDLSTLTNLQEIRLVDNILSTEINPLWDGLLIVPPITAQSSEKNPQLFEMTDYFKAIHADSLVVSVDFTNGYPIDVGKGTELVFRNADNKEEFFRHAIREQVAPGELYEFDIEVLTDESNPQKIESNIEFYLDNFRSNGTSGEIRDFTGTSTNFSFTIEFLSVLKLELYADKAWSDTIVTTISLFDEGVAQQRLAQGSIGLKLTNGLPINGLSFIEILDENDNKIGQIFTDTLKILPATIDPTTTEVLTRTDEDVLVELPFETLDLFYKQSKLKISYVINTNNISSDNLIIGESSFLRAKVKLDLKVYGHEVEIE